MLVRSMARTNAIGLRRDPQPPMPIVIPLRSCATASSRVVLLSGTMRRSPPQAGGTPTSSLLLSSSSPAALLLALRRTGKRVAVLVGNPGEIEFEGKALLHAVTGVDALDVDEVQRLLGRADNPGVLGSNVARHPQRGFVELLPRHHLMHRAEVVQGGGVHGGRGEEQSPHQVLWHQPGQVG